MTASTRLPFAEHVPERPVQGLGCRDGHVVRDHIDDQADAVLPEPCGHRTERLLAAQILADPAVVDDVVAVCRAWHRLQDRRGVDVRDSQVGEVVGQFGGGLEAELGAELEAGRYRSES